MDKSIEELIARFERLGGLPAIGKPKAAGDLISPYSRLWLNEDDQSCHHKDGDNRQIIYKACRARPQFKATDQGDGTTEFIIQGFASTNDLDTDNEIILPSAFESSLKTFMETGRMLFMHDWWSLPVGKWRQAEIQDGGLWMEDGIVLPTSMGKDLQLLIENDAINSLSIGFYVNKDEFDYDTGIRTITDLELLEVSIVNIPANPNAIFQMAKEQGLKSFINRSSDGPLRRKGNTMDPELVKLITKMSEGWDTQPGSVASVVGNLTQQLNKFNSIIAQVQQKVKDLHDPATLVNEADFLTFCENTKNDVTGLTESIKELQLQKREGEIEKAIITDWRSLLTKGIFLRDENGKALSPAHQKAYRILNLPVDFDKSEHGPIVKAARNLNDVCLILDAYYRGVKAAQYRGIQHLEAFQKLTDMMELLDPELAAGMKAMYTGGTGTGLEWIPTIFSGEVDTLYRIRPTLVNYLRAAWQMPSQTAKWPILSGAATAYLADEPASNNPKVLHKSNLSTSVVTFSARTIAAALPVSKILLEETLFDLAPVLREELVIALAEAEEDAEINGDNSASHFDTGRSLTSSDDDVKVAWKGLRKLAIDASNHWDTQSVTLGDGTTAFAAADCRYNRQLLGILGLNPAECLHVASIGGFYKALSFSQVTKANEFGFASTWLTGTLPALDGVEIYISAHLGENLNASGVYDNSVTDNTAWLTLHRRSFMPGERRGVALEFDYNPDVQQWLFIATMRRDFQNMRPSSQKPVAYGYNIDN